MGGVLMSNQIFPFDYPTDRSLIRGFWTPLKPPFSPFVDIEQITNMCYKWRFLEIIKGCYLRWDRLLIFPRSPTQASFSTSNKFYKR